MVAKQTPRLISCFRISPHTAKPHSDKSIEGVSSPSPAECLPRLARTDACPSTIT